MSLAVGYVASWKDRLRGRLYAQFKNAITWQAMADLLARQFQDLEDAYQSLLTLTSIDDSEGAQLDLIGRIVGQKRLGVDDPTYRPYLKARIQANKSTGGPENIYSVFTALFGAVGFLLTTSDIGTKQFSLRIKGVLTRAQALIGAAFLRDSKEAAARGVLEWQPDVDANLFRFDSGPAFDVGVFAGAEQS